MQPAVRSRAIVEMHHAGMCKASAAGHLPRPVLLPRCRTAAEDVRMVLLLEEPTPLVAGVSSDDRSDSSSAALLPLRHRAADPLDTQEAGQGSGRLESPLLSMGSSSSGHTALQQPEDRSIEIPELMGEDALLQLMTEAYGEMVMHSGRLDSVQPNVERRDWLRQLRKLANGDTVLALFRALRAKHSWVKLIDVYSELVRLRDNSNSHSSSTLARVDRSR